MTNWRAPTAAIRLVFLTIGIIVLLLLAWIGRVIVVLLFAAAIVAVLVSAVVDWLRATLRTRREFAFLLFLFGAALLILLTLWIKGPDIIEQFADLQTDLPQAAHALFERWKGYVWGRWLLAQWTGYAQLSGNMSSALMRIGGVVLSTMSLIAGLVLILILGLYLAAEPQVYLSGVRRMTPKNGRATFDACAGNAAQVLRSWLKSQLLSMTAVGCIVTAGLWALGVPLAGTLGAIAALLAFIPNLGPILSVVPAALLAVVISPMRGLLVILLFLVVHFIEGNIITPLLYRKIVRLPPALTLTAQLFLAVIAGPLGLALAAPFTAVTIGVLQMLVSDDNNSSLHPGAGIGHIS